MSRQALLPKIFGLVSLLSISGSVYGADPRIVIHTESGKLPASFVAANLSMPLKCLGDAKLRCSAWMMDVTDDGIDDVLILDGSTVWVFTERPMGKWFAVGQWGLEGACQKLLDAMSNGQFQAVTPVRPRWPDLEIAGERFSFSETRTGPAAC